MEVLPALPDLAIEIVLRYLDGKSVISLATSSMKLRRKIQTIVGGRLRGVFWSNKCDCWMSDPMMLQVIASFDPIFPELPNRNIVSDKRQENDTRGERRVTDFSWPTIILGAHDVVWKFRMGSFSLRRLKCLQDQIKTDIVLQYDKVKLESGTVSRRTGSAGSLFWNTLCPPANEHNPETALVFDKRFTCRRSVPTDQMMVFQAFVLRFPRAQQVDPCGITDHLPGENLVWNLLVIVGDTGVSVCPLHVGAPCHIRWNKYNFAFSASVMEKKMEPIVAVDKEFIAIWSQPYKLDIYKINVNEDGDVDNVLIRSYPEEPEGRGLGKLWSKMALHQCSFTCILSQDSGTGFELIISFPGLTKWKDGDVFTLSFASKPSEVRSNLQCFPTGAKTLIAKYIDFPKTTSGHGLHVYYTQELVAASFTGIQWFYRLWGNQFKDPNSPNPEVLVVEILAPNLLAVVSQQKLYIAQISVNPNLDVTCEFENALNQPWVHTEVIRKLDLGLCALLKQISSIKLDYDQGNPFLWVEAERVRKEEDGFELEDSPTSFDLYRLQCFL